jgi:NAD-dependent SIR2 family protein deacetylase
VIEAHEQGETLTPENRDQSLVPPASPPSYQLTTRLDLITNSSRLLVLGTSLATYSAFRLVKQAREQGKEVLIISLGPSRADPLEGVEKMERKAGDVLRVFLDETLKYVPLLFLCR